jgi:hypothetical protein
MTFVSILNPTGELPALDDLIQVRCMHDSNTSFQITDGLEIFMLRAENYLGNALSLFRLVESYPIEWCGLQGYSEYTLGMKRQHL